jgi:hypothetical protein
LIASLEKEASEITGRFVTLLIKSCESIVVPMPLGFGFREQVIVQVALSI